MEATLLPSLIPAEGEVLELLKSTGAIRSGHFRYPDGMYSSLYVQVALAMRDYQVAKKLSVALSRKIRQDKEIRAMIPELSVVSPATGGLPIAYGIVEALRANQIYWAEEDIEGKPQRFRQFIEPRPGEKVLIVDDILRSGRKLAKLRKLIIDCGAEVVGVAVMVYQPTLDSSKVEDVPFFYLAKLDAMYYRNASGVKLGPGEELVDILV